MLYFEVQVSLPLPPAAFAFERELAGELRDAARVALGDDLDRVDLPGSMVSSGARRILL